MARNYTVHTKILAPAADVFDAIVHAGVVEHPVTHNIVAGTLPSCVDRHHVEPIAALLDGGGDDNQRAGRLLGQRHDRRDLVPRCAWLRSGSTHSLLP